ncbi:MAG TPA: AtpZ/AtpI family protein [Longimicrobiales bacterium]|nr:AtpZ/AtpI family protein [Longimicrobiales bacterium]
MVQHDRKPPPSAAAQASKYAGVGLTWALSTMLFLFLGAAADRRLGTTPWLTLVGAFVGAGAGFWYMYYHLVIAPQQRRNRDGKAGD